MSSSKRRKTDGDEAARSNSLPGFAHDVDERFSHMPEHGFSIFLADRTKTIHFVRHAEGIHNQANAAYGDDTPCTYTTEGAEQYIDAHLTKKGVNQCLKVRALELQAVHPELVVVSPFTRTLQTAHLIFGGDNGCHGKFDFMVHDLCRERWGKYTCDKRRSKAEIVAEMAPIYKSTSDSIDFDTYGYPTEDDVDWTEQREPDDDTTARGVKMLQWLASRPEREIAVVTHSSYLRHLFDAFGWQLDEQDQNLLQRKTGNAEVRSVTLAMHRGFFPEGEWVDDRFVPKEPCFRRGIYAPRHSDIAAVHSKLAPS